jgi:hypothetical protein
MKYHQRSESLAVIAALPRLSLLNYPTESSCPPLPSSWLHNVPWEMVPPPAALQGLPRNCYMWNGTSYSGVNSKHLHLPSIRGSRVAAPLRLQLPRGARSENAALGSEIVEHLTQNGVNRGNLA